MEKKRAIITGATGMVGSAVLQYCIDHTDIGDITVVGRRPMESAPPEVRQIMHEDFGDMSGLGEQLAGFDIAFFCIGVYTGAVDDERFREITVDYTIAFATALKQWSPDATFCFLSGQGADLTEKSRLSFARYKGAAEKALMSMDFQHLAIFRPGYIYPSTPREEPNLMYRISRLLYPVARYVYPNIGLTSDDLARVMVKVGAAPELLAGRSILENRDIRALLRG
ncbi:NAD-dependent epimerase/dehydratase family protein [bacterium]|nr:NAD-dependent epimerase/dehydratase family protein [bacterium]